MCYWFNPERSIEAEALDSAVQALSPGDKDPPVLVCFMRSLLSHADSSALALSQPAITCLPCTCPHRDISPQFPLPLPRLVSSHHHHLLPSAGLVSITVLLEPAGNPPAQPVLGAPSQSTVITIIQQLSLHKSVLPDQLCPH